MDYLWSPWRYQYVTSADRISHCVFCAAAGGERDEDHFIVHRGSRNFILLNLYPYTSGHLMVVPYQHAATLEALPEETVTEMMLLVRDAERHLRGLYHPHGINLGMNIGEAAGAGVAGHVHMHVMPRWVGDTSFITTVAETRILPEDLSVTYQKLKRAFASQP